MPKFYNAGNKIDEMFPFSLPDGADIHVIGRWTLLAPKESWFTVPTELVVGNSTIAVQFAKDVQRKFGKRGVVVLDPTYDRDAEDPDKPLEFYAVAPTEDLVIERAQTLWRNYLEEICKAHFEDVQNAMSAGGAPRAAKGFTVHALKLCGYQDPAERYFLAQKEGQNGKAAGISPEVAGVLAQMQQQNQAMMAMVMAVVTGQKIDPAVLAQLQTHAPAPAPVTPAVAPENAGSLEVDGQGETSLEQRIHRKDVQYDTLKTQPADRKGRAAAASKQL